jgi:hypothetical protein
MRGDTISVSLSDVTQDGKMPDEQNGQDAPNNAQPTPTSGKTPTNGDDWKMEDLPPSTQAYIRQLRDEAKQTRLEKEAAEKARKEAEQQQLVEQGNWKKLAEDRAAELAKLTPYQQKAEELEKIINDNNTQMINQIPEADRAEVLPPLPPAALNAWLVKNLKRLTRKTAPETDAGAGMGGSGDKNAVLTDDEKAMARAMNITEKAFAEQKARK